jgi:SAM-dependent methyltransferase
MIDWMSENIVQDNPCIIPTQMDGISIPLENASADLVFMINLHHELDEPLAVLKEARRLLKTGGKIFISDWKKEEMKMGPPKNIRCRTGEVSAQLTEAGFHNISVDDSLAANFLITAEG